MSTGGNVPTQGISISEATTEKKRGSRCEGHPNGYIGKGSAGSRLKSLWSQSSRSQYSLKEFAKSTAKYNGTEPELVLSAKDAKEWLSSKRYRGTDEQRKVSTAARKRRQDMRYATKKADKLSPPKKTKSKSISGGGDEW